MTTILFDLRTCTELVHELSASFDHFRERRMNDILYILTVATTCVIPAQLLTGIFGMNFASTTNEMGLQDPFLKWEHGYLFFWLVSILCTLTLMVLFKYST